MNEVEFKPILTICIPTVSGRETQLNALLTDCLFEQLRLTPEAIVLIEKDNKEMTIGAKRQLLLDKVTTPYFVMVDDDDTLAPDFVEEVLQAIEWEPDCIGYLLEIRSGRDRKIAIHSDRYEHWSCGMDGYDYIRTISDKNPIRTTLARKIGFKDVRFAEDHDFSKRLKESGLVKKEVFIPKIMYIYNAPGNLSKEESNKRYGIE